MPGNSSLRLRELGASASDSLIYLENLPVDWNTLFQYIQGMYDKKAYDKQWKDNNKDRVREHHRKWTKANIEKARASRRKWYHENREKEAEKKKSRRAVELALRSGDLVRPDRCSCGAPNPEAHHHKGYDPEYYLDVQWLCKICHAQADKK